MRNRVFLIGLSLALLAGPLFAEEAAAAKVDVEVETARALVTLLSEGEFQAVFEQFDERMKEAMPVPKMEEFWTSLEQQAGTFEGFGEARSRDEQDYRLVELDCNFSKMGIRSQVAFDAEKNVVGLFFRPGGTKTAATESDGG